MKTCEVGHKKHDTKYVQTKLGWMTVFDRSKYDNLAGSYCPGQAVISGELERIGVWEERLYPMVANILNYGSRDKLVIDVGASIGWYSRMASLVGYDVLAFEGNKENAELLKLNASEAEIRDNWFDKDTKDKIDIDRDVWLIKLDIEGSEAHAMRYLEPILPRTNNIMMEISPVFNKSYPKLIEKLIRMGFGAIDEKGELFDFEYDFNQKDLFFIKYN